MDTSWIRTGDGIEAEVSCNVHAEPRAEVKWYKDTMLLDPTNNRHMESYGNKHVLILRHVGEADFGNYSCTADNSLGRQRGFVDVSGRPHPAKIVSNQLSYFKDQYNLTWTVDSFLPITEYRILYRVFSVRHLLLLTHFVTNTTAPCNLCERRSEQNAHSVRRPAAACLVKISRPAELAAPK